MPRPVVPTSIPGDLAPSTPPPRPPLLKDSPPLGFGAGTDAGFRKMSDIGNFFTEIFKFLPPAEVSLYSGESTDILQKVQKAWWEGRDPATNQVVKGFEANSLSERSASESALNGAVRGHMRTDWMSVPIDNSGNRTGPYHNSNGAAASGRHYGHWHRMNNFSDDAVLSQSLFGTEEGKHYEASWNDHAGISDNTTTRWLHATQSKTLEAMVNETSADDNFQTILAAMGHGEWTKMNEVLDNIGTRLNTLKTNGEGYATGTSAVTAGEAKFYGQKQDITSEDTMKDGDGKDVKYVKRFDANYLETVESGAYRTFSDEEAYYFLLSMAESYFRFLKGFREIVGRIEDLPSVWDPQWSLDPNFVLSHHSQYRPYTTGSPNPRLIENINAMFQQFFSGGLTNMSSKGDVNPEYFSIVNQFLKPLHSVSNITQIFAGISSLSYSGEGDRFSNFKTFMDAAVRRYLLNNKSAYTYQGQGITRYERYFLDVGAEDYKALSQLYLRAGGSANNLPAFNLNTTAAIAASGGPVAQLLNKATYVAAGSQGTVTTLDSGGKPVSRPGYVLSGTRDNGSSYSYSFASAGDILAAITKVRDNINEYWRFSPYNAVNGVLDAWGTHSGGLGSSDYYSMMGNGLVFDEISSRGAAQIEMSGRDYSKSGSGAVGSGHAIAAYDGNGIWKISNPNVQVAETKISTMSSTRSDGVYDPLYQWGKNIQNTLGVDGYITMDKLPTTTYAPDFSIGWGEARALDSYMAPVDQVMSGWGVNTVMSPSRAMFQNYLVRKASADGSMIVPWNASEQDFNGAAGYRAPGSSFEGVAYQEWNTRKNPLFGREWMATLYGYLNDAQKEGMRRFSYVLLNNIQENRRYNDQQDEYFEKLIEEIQEEADLKKDEQKAKSSSQQLEAQVAAAAARAAAQSKALSSRSINSGKKKK